ncbi:hemolysin family protein [Mesorhizobium sp. YIM 152430]|uniref:hemolysin family protein n=1 Tax=Mesorhizobium sp. YIM 152430 TaxID=3031761 RepID=UPI0023DC173E|nr:hemolysin family protein [Mesorhizobium sp. YIM 152430]MDF1598517.1 hemolysin family protein [Mesorhizobium sp. YIM 152430]
MLTIEIAIVVVLICVNGVLAMSELAVVSSRPARLKAMAEENVSGARSAIRLASDPGRFLSTVQIGITLVGVLSGAFSGATLGLRLSAWLLDAGLPASAANPLGVGIVVALITYGSLIIGELVPKQIALKNPERVAVRVAPMMKLLSRIALPLVWLLDVSGKAVLKLLGQDSQDSRKVTDEEIAALMAEAESSGVIETDERRMIAGVMRLADRSVRSIMTPRLDVDWLDVDAAKEIVRRKLIETQHSHLPVAENGIDGMLGIVRTRDVLSHLLSGREIDLRAVVKDVPIVHDYTDALDVLATLRMADIPMALVHDEYGNFEGLVTPTDILEAIAGVFRFDSAEDEPMSVARDDGSWLLSGWMPADDMAETLGLKLPNRRSYETVAGFVLSHLNRLPETGEKVEALGWRFEVVDMDGRRIDKVIAARILSEP